MLAVHSGALLSREFPIRRAKPRPRRAVCPSVLGQVLQQAPFHTCGTLGHYTAATTLFVAIASDQLQGGRTRRCRRILLQAVSEQPDGHTRAVRRWVDRFVVGLGLCPWALEAQGAGHIRVVTSTAVEAEEVAVDAFAEAERLSCMHRTPAGGTPVTTLLVCPHVVEWADFNNFALFFAETFSGGHELVDTLGIKLVAFHPLYSLHNGKFQCGERVATATPGLPLAWGTVTAVDLGCTEEGDVLVGVRLDCGDEGVLVQDDIDYVVPIKGRHDGSADGEDDEANLILRAPRPLLHLLRCKDLALAEEAGLRGDGPGIMNVLRRNEKQIRRLGAVRAKALLDQCG